MSSAFPEITLVRHGETEWSLSGRHTGRSDIPLTENGEEAARGVGPRLAGHVFAEVWSSPSQRARNTCSLAGFEAGAIVKAGSRRMGLRCLRRHQDQGNPGGTPRLAAVSRRLPGWRNGRRYRRQRRPHHRRNPRRQCAAILIFSSSHFLRVLGARWLGLPPEDGARFILDTTSISVLGYEHDLTEPVIRRWNGQ
jgi:broad specificity phosphatase PhoE